MRLSDRLTGEVDAPEIVLLYALATGVVAVVALPIMAVAVKVRWIAAGWLAVPVGVLLAAVFGVCSVAGDL